MSERPNNVVYINCRIEGEPAKTLRELCNRGLVRSHADAINQGLLALYEKVVAKDLQIAQLKRLVEGERFEPP